MESVRDIEIAKLVPSERNTREDMADISGHCPKTNGTCPDGNGTCPDKEVPMTSRPKTCEECWRFVAIECDRKKSEYGACDIDMEQVLKTKPACDMALPKGDDDGR